MTNAELIQKIRAEIERLKGICTAQINANPGQTFPFVMEMTGYDKLLSFLSTLESEKPMNQEGLEKEIDKRYLQTRVVGKQEWSEEDSKRYISIGTTLGTSEVLTKEDYDANMAWLRELVNAKKSLRPSWKPSEEQLNALNFAITYFMHETNYKNPTELRDLYDELLKLK